MAASSGLNKKELARWPTFVYAMRRAFEANPAFGFGAQKGEKLRAMGNPESSETNKVAAFRTPADPPSQVHISQLRGSSTKQGFQGIRVRVQTSSTQAVGPFRTPAYGDFYGSTPRTEMFRETTAASQYTCFSRLIAPLFRRGPKLPRARFYDNFGIIAPR